MIELRHITKTFHSQTPNEVKALIDVDLEVQRSEFVVIIGANGSGKTTLLNVISGAIRPSAGEILLDGQSVGKIPEYRRSRWIARVFQDPLGGTAPDLSILDNFRLAALRTQPKQWRVGINDAFRRKVADRIAGLKMGLEHKLDQPMGTLSGGQRQALTLLMSVMDHTDILLLDEPTAALDPRSAELVMQTAQELIREHRLTAILITHNLRDALRHGRRLIQMDHGRIARDLGAEEKARLDLPTILQWFE